MDLLFHHDVVVAPLASGSRGNCTYVGTPRSGVLVDCGLSTRQVLRRMTEIGLGDARVDAVVITHEHADHVGAARVLCERLFREQGRRVPFYMTRGTRRGLNPRCVPQRVEFAVAGQRFPVGALVVEPCRIPHDVHDPVAYLIRHGEVHVGVITDLGRSTRLVEQQLSRCDIAVVEFNHDLEMLLDGPYPWPLKQRVRGPHGHLSNDQARALVAGGATSRLKHLILAHLSEDNNRPELALEAAQQGLREARLGGIEVHVASQQRPLGPLRVPTPAARRPRASPPPEPAIGQLSLF